jgi:hypothetical protein
VIHLLDVNVLIALLDAEHIAHDDAHDWFDVTGKHGWATCPIVENGFLRIVGASRYGPASVPMARLIENLTQFTRADGHEFWAEDFSLLTNPDIHRDKLTSAGQLTDTYLLALAVRNGGRLATLDRRFSTRSVEGGERALVQIPARSVASD